MKPNRRATVFFIAWIFAICLGPCDKAIAEETFQIEQRAEEIVIRMLPLPDTDAILETHSLPAAARNQLPYAELVNQAAQSAAVDPDLLHAVMAVESGYNPAAISPRGARGLMQLMPDTARQFGVTDPHDPGQNILAGARYLGQLLKVFDQEIPLALAAYNAGPGAVQRHGRKIPPYAETQTYVPRVLARYRNLQSRRI